MVQERQCNQDECQASSAISPTGIASLYSRRLFKAINRTFLAFPWSQNPPMSTSDHLAAPDVPSRGMGLLDVALHQVACPTWVY